MMKLVSLGFVVFLASHLRVEAGLSAHQAIVSASAPEDLTSAGGHHQSEWIPASHPHAGAHSFVAGGQTYGHQLSSGPSPAYYNPYGYHSAIGGGGAVAQHHHQHHEVHAPVHHSAPEIHHNPSVQIAPLISVPGYKPVPALLQEPLHEQKKIVHQHHEHQKVIHQHHIHQHVLHEHHLHKVHLHDLHLQDQNIHQHHKHIEHIHQPVYHVHNKHALKQTEEHRHHQTVGESHEHAPIKVHESKSHAPPVYATKSHGGGHHHVKAVAAPIFYKSAPVHPWG